MSSASPTLHSLIIEIAEALNSWSLLYFDSLLWKDVSRLIEVVVGIADWRDVVVIFVVVVVVVAVVIVVAVVVIVVVVAAVIVVAVVVIFVVVVVIVVAVAAVVVAQGNYSKRRLFQAHHSSGCFYPYH